MTNTNVESISSLDFEFTPPCEATGPVPRAMATVTCHGENPAEFFIKTACLCDKPPSLLCSPCLNSRLTRTQLRCSKCFTVFEPAITAYKIIRPIKS